MVTSVEELKARLLSERNTSSEVEAFDPLKLLGILQEVKGVQCYTLYVRDPITDEFRLERHWGVKHIEPLEGFVLSSAQERLIRESNVNRTYGQREYFLNPNEAKLIGPAEPPLPITTKLKELSKAEPAIYGTFAEREGIEACLRYESSANESSLMVLFVNLSRQLPQESEELHFIDQVFEDLNCHVDAIRAAMEHEYPKSLRQLTCLLRPIHHLAAQQNQTNYASACELFIADLLSAVASSLNVSPVDGFASIHLYEPELEGGILRLASCTVRREGLPGYYKVFSRKSIVAWVAMKQHPLLINNMNDSAFKVIRRIHEDHPDMQSELAVPMLSGGELIGVINVETRQKDAFTREDLYALWIAASEAAAAYRVFRSLSEAAKLAEDANRIASQAEEIKLQTDRLLGVALRAVKSDSDDDSYLNEIAGILMEWSQAGRSEIWMYDPIERTFGHAGASYDGFKRNLPPRLDGWTNFIFQGREAVWIEVYGSDRNFTARFWDESNSSWNTNSAVERLIPQALHSVVLDEGVKCELGFPIVKQGKPIGVIWLKHDVEMKAAPDTESMKRLTMLTGQVALMMDLLSFAEKREEKEVRDAIAKEHFPVGEILNDGMEGYLLYAPCDARLGGDFCTMVKTSTTSWGYLLGDVAGHGYRAALRMLPLITAFKIYQKECGSPDYALGQLVSLFSEKDQFGTGVAFACFSKECSNNSKPHEASVRRFISAASAGHPPLALIRGGNVLKVDALPDIGGPGHTAGFGPERFEHFAAQTIEVHTGDILIGYTDGVDEIFRGKEMFGRDRILAAAIAARNRAPQEIAEAIYQLAREWGNGTMLDDVTIFVAKMV